MRLSQDAQWALRHRAAHTRPGQKKVVSWLPIGIIAVLFIALAAILVVSCSTSVGPEPTGSTWGCLSAPHIRIAFDSYDNYGYGYYRLFVGNEVTECRTPLAELTDMLKDGHWEQIETGNPLFLPPPPYWSTRPQTQGTGIRINGSVCISMQTRTPLPNDSQITILRGGVN
jgi:hypothetical protein